MSPQAKAELILECMKLDVQVLRMALQCRVNANLPHRWIVPFMGVAIEARQMQ